MMKKQILLLGFLFLLLSNQSFSQDAEGCKEHPMFPSRMSNYSLTECKHNFDAVEFNLAAEGLKTISKEGTVSVLRYDFNAESGQQKPSVLQIQRNYEAAAKKIGAITMFQSVGEVVITFKIVKTGKEVAWAKIEGGGDNNNDFYILTIVELEDMKQEITSTDMLTALNTDGHMALYINFESGKSTIKPESQNIIDQITDLLKSNTALKISIEGHTDNVGTAAANKILSENRAKAVMTALIAKAIDKSRLSAKGWGQDKAIADNNTEDGKAKNRRVDIVKQ